MACFQTQHDMDTNYPISFSFPTLQSASIAIFFVSFLNISGYLLSPDICPCQLLCLACFSSHFFKASSSFCYRSQFNLQKDFIAQFVSSESPQTQSVLYLDFFFVSCKYLSQFETTDFFLPSPACKPFDEDHVCLIQSYCCP